MIFIDVCTWISYLKSFGSKVFRIFVIADSIDC